MKTDRKKNSKAAVSSKRGTLVTAACMMLLMLGAAGVFAFSGKDIQTTDVEVKDQTHQTTTAAVTETTAQTTAEQETYTLTNQIKWHKAGIGEYNVANAKQTVTTTTTAATTTAESSVQTQQTTYAAPQATTTTKATTKATTQATTAKPVTTTTKATTKAAVTTTPAVKTVYDSPKISYTDEEFEMFCYVVQAEAGYSAEYYKIAISNVIINRVKSPRFANNIKGVLTAANQFTCITNYYNKTNKPTQNTIDCCKRALNGEDNSNGAVYYYSPKYVGASVAAWFESMQLCVAFETARFFKPW